MEFKSVASVLPVMTNLQISIRIYDNHTGEFPGTLSRDYFEAEPRSQEGQLATLHEETNEHPTPCSSSI